jgi:translation initiation factor 3 subunit H
MIVFFYVADTAKTAQGFISLKAYRLTPEAIKMFRENDFSPDYVKVRRYSFTVILCSLN